MLTKREELAIDLYNIGAVKFGSFKLKSGDISPIYCDFRDLFSYPSIWQKLTHLLINKLSEMGQIDAVCGVPYTALPLASIVSIKKEIVMLMKRKERKTYGTGKLIEGVYEKGQNILIIEDVVTTGSSIIETAKELRAEGLEVTKALVVLNREQNGRDNLKQNGIEMFEIFKLMDLLRMLRDHRHIETIVIDNVRNYLTSNKEPSNQKVDTRLNLRYEDRKVCSKNEITKQLFDIIISKKSNLCAALDFSDPEKILNLAKQIGHFVCLIKIHCDIIDGFSEEFVDKLKLIANECNFLIMEDRKFADIGQITQLQFSKGVYNIGSWADFVTVHAISGPEILKALSNFIKSTNKNQGIFLVAELSTASNLIDKNYTERAIDMCKDYDNILTGFVGQNRLCASNPGIFQLTPGVQLNVSSDNLGQVYNNPEKIILEKGADIAVVGRGITMSENAAESAENYRDLLWAAYEKRVSLLTN